MSEMKMTDFVATVFDGHSNPTKATVAFTMAVKALEKGHTATVILMVNAIELGQPGAADDIDVGAPFTPLKQLWAQFLERGGQIALCAACMGNQGYTAEQMDSRYFIINGPDIVDLLMAAKGTLQIG